MSNPPAISKVKHGEASMLVRAPRMGDAVASSLSAAFECADGLPDDWQALLARLDQDAPRVQR